jgi:Tfp pilus assembly protein PilF
MAPFIGGGRPLDEVDVYFEALNANLTRHWAPLTGLVARRLKFIDLPTAELYDLAADPGETTNLFGPRQAEADAIARRVFALRAVGKPAAPEAVDPATAQRLRALGYVVTPAAPTGTRIALGDDPKALIGLHTQLDDALAALRGGRPAVAETLLRTLIVARPDFTVAHDRLAQLYRDTGRLTQAVATLEASSKAGHADAASLAALGGYLQEAGNLERSRQVLEAALTLNPAESETYEKLGVTYTRLGSFDRAHAMFAHMLSLSPDSATTLNNLGSLLLAERRWPAGPPRCRHRRMAQSPRTAPRPARCPR